MSVQADGSPQRQPLAGGVGDREAVQVWGRGEVGSLCFPFHFAVDLTLLKKIVF